MPERCVLETRMKDHERASLQLQKVLPTQSFLVRLDGHGFSKFTKGLKPMKGSAHSTAVSEGPYDLSFVRAMALTTGDLLTEFSAQTGYTHSDEITLVFDRVSAVGAREEVDTAERVHSFNGRVVKMLTLMAGFASARFNWHLQRLVCGDGDVAEARYAKDMREHVARGRAYFDSRVVVFDQLDAETASAAAADSELVFHQVWRSMLDCPRNAVLGLAHWTFGPKAIENKPVRVLRSMLKERGVPDLPLYLEHGVYVKRQLVEKAAVDRKTGQEVIAKRTELASRCLLIDGVGDANAIGPVDDPVRQGEIEARLRQYSALLFAKYWPEDSDLHSRQLTLELEPRADTAAVQSKG